MLCRRCRLKGYAQPGRFRHFTVNKKGVQEVSTNEQTEWSDQSSFERFISKNPREAPTSREHSLFSSWPDTLPEYFEMISCDQRRGKRRETHARMKSGPATAKAFSSRGNLKLSEAKSSFSSSQNHAVNRLRRVRPQLGWQSCDKSRCRSECWRSK
jgi:hypothetical protein